MGVYHFMGLGLSIGAVTAPVSYISARQQRWDATDQAFFALSGERAQDANERRGDIEALVLFTTEKVRTGVEIGRDFQLNRAGGTGGEKKSGRAVGDLLRRYLPQELAGATDRPEISLYWCDVIYDDPIITFERMMTVLLATKPPGRMGKEIWINLTGGNNIINSALNLTASLTGMPARMYYLISEDDHYLRHTVSQQKLGTAEDNFWVELPIPYTVFNPNHRELLQFLEEYCKDVPLEIDAALSYIQRQDDIEPITGKNHTAKIKLFHRLYLVPLQAQGLIEVEDDHIVLGPAWMRYKRYYATEFHQDEEQERKTLRHLVEDMPWFHLEKLEIR